jgi:hypothetical protein
MHCGCPDSLHTGKVCSHKFAGMIVLAKTLTPAITINEVEPMRFVADVFTQLFPVSARDENLPVRTFATTNPWYRTQFIEETDSITEENISFGPGRPTNRVNVTQRQSTRTFIRNVSPVFTEPSIDNDFGGAEMLSDETVDSRTGSTLIPIRDTNSTPVRSRKKRKRRGNKRQNDELNLSQDTTPTKEKNGNVTFTPSNHGHQQETQIDNTSQEEPSPPKKRIHTMIVQDFNKKSISRAFKEVQDAAEKGTFLHRDSRSRTGFIEYE